MLYTRCLIVIIGIQRYVTAFLNCTRSQCINKTKISFRKTYKKCILYIRSSKIRWRLMKYNDLPTWFRIYGNNTVISHKTITFNSKGNIFIKKAQKNTLKPKNLTWGIFKNSIVKHNCKLIWLKKPRKWFKINKLDIKNGGLSNTCI